MRISDWSSDVCSSDLQRPRDIDRQAHLPQGQTEPRPARGAQGVAVAEDGPREGARTAGHAHPHRSREGHRRLRAHPPDAPGEALRSEEHTSELQSLMRISYAVFCLKKKRTDIKTTPKKKTLHTVYSIFTTK